MYRYDYVLRLIERLGQVLRRLRSRLLQQQVSNDDLRAEIQEIAREAGLDLAFARQLEPGMLATWLAPFPDSVNEDRVWLMAELLFAEALTGRGQVDRDHTEGDLRRALALFSRIPPGWKPADSAPSASERVAEVQAQLDDLDSLNH